ncbi:unnamed protein product [marine sediment metagenome]|uniref:Uncharacterized protein n=1 Tax=marine sediment metagenome TaxID=412755 RepID=X1SQK4_9ZZZZ
MMAAHLTKVVAAIEDESRPFSAKVTFEVVEMPSMAAVARESWRDGMKVLTYPMTSVAGLKFYSLYKGRFEAQGIRYVQTQYLHCIDWCGDWEWFRGRYYVIEKEICLSQRSRPRFKWRLYLSSRLPWWHPEPEEEVPPPKQESPLPNSSPGSNDEPDPPFAHEVM